MNAKATALVLLLLSTSALADQQAWVSRADADRAAVLMPVGSTLRSHCAPCGDVTWSDAEIAQVEVVYTGSEEYWEVQVNGRGIDLAYSYVERDGRWENLALLLGLEAFDVPRFVGPPSTDPEAELAALEKELEHLEAALSGSAPRAARQLDRARKAWRKFVEAQVKAEVAVSGAPEAATEVRLRLTRLRVADLLSLLIPDI